MSDEPKTRITDLVGLEPLMKSAEIITQASVDAANAFLSKLCMPAIKELGLYLKDKVHGWRTANYVAVAQKAEKTMKASDLPEGIHAHPRIVHEIVDQSSWTDDATVQDLWAGLLVSSCTDAGDDDSNLIFTNILSSLTKLQARLLKYVCENAKKHTGSRGLIFSVPLTVPLETLVQVGGDTDLHRLDRELDVLRDMGLLAESAGISLYPFESENVIVTPSALGLNMYVRCQGSRLSPAEFFNAEPHPDMKAPTGAKAT